MANIEYFDAGNGLFVLGDRCANRSIDTAFEFGLSNVATVLHPGSGQLHQDGLRERDQVQFGGHPKCNRSGVDNTLFFRNGRLKTTQLGCQV